LISVPGDQLSGSPNNRYACTNFASIAEENPCDRSVRMLNPGSTSSALAQTDRASSIIEVIDALEERVQTLYSLASAQAEIGGGNAPASREKRPEALNAFGRKAAIRRA
jgi:hypothetical protein